MICSHGFPAYYPSSPSKQSGKSEPRSDPCDETTEAGSANGSENSSNRLPSSGLPSVSRSDFWSIVLNEHSLSPVQTNKVQKKKVELDPFLLNERSPVGKQNHSQESCSETKADKIDCGKSLLDLKKSTSKKRQDERPNKSMEALAALAIIGLGVRKRPTQFKARKVEVCQRDDEQNQAISCRLPPLKSTADFPPWVDVPGDRKEKKSSALLSPLQLVASSIVEPEDQQGSSPTSSEQKVASGKRPADQVEKGRQQSLETVDPPAKKQKSQDVKRISCPKCPIFFEADRALKSHLAKAHRAPKQFKCPECEYWFRGKHEVKRHVQAVHRKERPYACPLPLCDLRFARRATMRKHCINVHKDDPLNPYREQG